MINYDNWKGHVFYFYELSIIYYQWYKLPKKPTKCKVRLAENIISTIIWIQKNQVE
jgi:hypothetical protein